MGTLPPPTAGAPWPLGASCGDEGANFALFSSAATRVELCLFDPVSGAALGRLDLPGCTDGVWHGALPGWRAPIAYGYRVHGPNTAGTGNRFNPARLLLDPYAKALAGRFQWDDSHLDGAQAASDNAAHMVRGLLRPAPAFDWGDDRPPRTPLADTVLYEAHVKGFTRLHPELPAGLRGTFAGLACPPVVDHLQRLGVTAVNLLPVHYAIDELNLVQRGKVNYWGYNTLGFFAPSPRLAAGDPDTELRSAVRALHAAGIEVILDVVYNHTAEGDHRGPTLSWRGIDNAAYYRLRHEDPRAYENDTGCGNTLNVSHPRVLQMVLDSLRHWVSHYRVDGFRFDLATVLGRTDQGFDPRCAFFQAIAQDPVLQRVKLIAEPWDVGPGGYRLGGFPAGWSEWNDRYRDDVRAFWIQKAGDRGRFARRLAGSSDVFAPTHRGATASVNYLTAHDGFTLQDLVSYDRKHNEANGEGNRDGASDNLSWNCGVEGPTEMKGVNARRIWLKRALLATLMVSRGVPMLTAGDEFGRTQRGNNNAYCQDNEISWVDWAGADRSLADFVASLVAVRREFGELRGDRWLRGLPVSGARRDIVWINRRGAEMMPDQWNDQNRYVFGMQFAAGRRVLVLFNAEIDPWSFPLLPGAWELVFDTSGDVPFDCRGQTAQGTFALQGCSVVMMQQR